MVHPRRPTQLEVLRRITDIVTIVVDACPLTSPLAQPMSRSLFESLAQIEFGMENGAWPVSSSTHQETERC